MEKWEYEITIHPLKDVLSDAIKEAGTITCDPQGICMYKDMPSANREAVLRIMNQNGALGWELVETHFNHKNTELLFIWKKKKLLSQMEH